MPQQVKSDRVQNAIDRLNVLTEQEKTYIQRITLCLMCSGAPPDLMAALSMNFTELAAEVFHGVPMSHKCDMLEEIEAMPKN